MRKIIRIDKERWLSTVGLRKIQVTCPTIGGKPVNAGDWREVIAEYDDGDTILIYSTTEDYAYEKAVEIAQRINNNCDWVDFKKCGQ